ncbi:MAG: PIG-L deacetylase family protein [Chloroflexota bacterium]
MAEEHQLEKRAMVIVAHPDDAEFGSAGTTALWVSQGWDVRYVVVTDGTAGGGDDATDVGPEARRKLSETRKAEQRAACDVLGVSGIDFLDYPDGQVQHTLELRKKLVRLMRTHRPSRVIVQSPDRMWDPYRIGFYHPDHIAVAETAIAALYPGSQNPWDFPELLLDEGLKPHKVSELWVVGAPVRDTFVDVSSVIDKKIDALRAHDSQLGANFDRLEKRVRSWMRETGERHGVEYAEEFHVALNWRPEPEETDSDADLAATPRSSDD